MKKFMEKKRKILIKKSMRIDANLLKNSRKSII